MGGNKSQKVNVKSEREKVKECVYAYVLHRQGKYVHPLLGTQSAPVSCIISEIERAGLDISQQTTSGHYNPCSLLWTNRTSFSFSCSKTLHKDKHLVAPTPKDPQSLKSGPGTFTFYVSRLTMTLQAILQISSSPRINVADFQRQISHLIKDVLQNSTFFGTYSILNVFRKCYSWNTSGLTVSLG